MIDLDAIAEVIEEAVAEQDVHGSFVEALRFAALVCIEEMGVARAADFGDAAASLDLHRQGAINRFNEAKKDFAVAIGG